VSELVPRREETRAHHSSKIGCGRDAWSGGGACPSWSRGAKRPGRITVQKSGAVEMRGAVEERVRAGPAARRDPGASQLKNRVRSRCVER